MLPPIYDCSRKRATALETGFPRKSPCPEALTPKSGAVRAIEMIQHEVQLFPDVGGAGITS